MVFPKLKQYFNLASLPSRLLSRILLKYNTQGFGRNGVKRLSEKDMHQLYHLPFIRTKETRGLERSELLTGQIKCIEKSILERARKERSVQLFHTILGIGDILAFTILHERGDINRFAHARAFCSYCRIIPDIYQSSDKTFRSPNSKQGNHYLKWAFSQAAYHVMKYHCPCRYFLDNWGCHGIPLLSRYMRLVGYRYISGCDTLFFRIISAGNYQ
jgi:transposase